MTFNKFEGTHARNNRPRHLNRGNLLYPKLRILVGLIASVLSIYAAFSIALKPVISETFTYTWTPTSQTDSGVFPLDRSWPTKLTVDFAFTCQDDIEKRIVSLGGLQIDCLHNHLSVISGSSKVKSVPAELMDRFRLEFISDESKIRIINLTSLVSATTNLPYIDFPKVTQLVANDPQTDLITLSLSTRPTSIESDYSRLLLVLMAAAFAIVSIVMFEKPKINRSSKHSSIKKFWKQGLFVASGLVASAFAIPMFYDDGWVLQRINQFISTGYLGDFYFHSNAWLPQGFLTESVLALFIKSGIGYLGLKFIVSFLLLISWVLIIKAAITVLGKLSQSSVWIASATFLSISAIWCMSLRAEPWICLFLSAQLYFFTRYFQNKRLLDFYLSGVFAALAIATHQSGLLAIVGAVGMLYIALKSIGRNQKFSLIISIIGIISSFVAIFFWGYDFNSIVSSVKDFSDGAYENRLNEFGRVAEISGSFISSARKFGWLVAGIVLIFAVANFHKLTQTSKLFVLILLFYPLGFLFTSSKWGWHVGVVSIPISLLLLFILNIESSAQPKNQSRYVLWLPALVITIGVSLASSGGWGTYDHRNISWEDFSKFYAGSQSQYFWYLAAIFFAMLGYLIDRVRTKILLNLGNSLIVLLLVFPSLASVTWITTDSFGQKDVGTISWTMFRQNLKTALAIGKDSCGILGSVPAYTSGIQNLEVSNATLPLNPLVQKETKLFGWNNVSIWSSEVSDNQLQATPFFELPKLYSSEKIVTWWSSISKQKPDYANIFVIYNLKSGQQVTEQYKKEIPDVGGVWNKLELNVPQDAISLSISITGNYEDFLMISEPVIAIQGNARTTLSEGTTFVPPSYLPSVPCAQLPSAKDGLFPIPLFVVSENYNLDTRMWIEQYFSPASAMITELGQVEKGTPGIWRIKFVEASKVTKSKEVFTGR